MKVYNQRHILEAARRYLPNAALFPHDRDRHILTRPGWQKLHAEFHWWLRDAGIDVYGMGSDTSTQKFEKNDCDDYGIHFMSWLRRRNAVTKNAVRAIAHMGMHYLVEGDPERGHLAILAFLVDERGVYCEGFEPQPNGGLFECTLEERNSSPVAYG